MGAFIWFEEMYFPLFMFFFEDFILEVCVNLDFSILLEIYLVIQITLFYCILFEKFMQLRLCT